MNLKLYALFDRNEGRFFSPAVGVDDEDFSKYIVNELNKSIDHIEKEEEKTPFILKVRSCEVFRLGEIDEITGELKCDKQFLVDLQDFKKEVQTDGVQVQKSVQ